MPFLLIIVEFWTDRYFSLLYVRFIVDCPGARAILKVVYGKGPPFFYIFHYLIITHHPCVYKTSVIQDAISVTINIHHTKDQHGHKPHKKCILLSLIYDHSRIFFIEFNNK